MNKNSTLRTEEAKVPTKIYENQIINDIIREYSIWDHIYISGFEEYQRVVKKFDERSCIEYFNQQMELFIKSLEVKIRELPLDIQKEACHIFFGRIKFDIDFWRDGGNAFQSPETMKKWGHKVTDIADYKKFLKIQEKAFSVLLKISPERQKQNEFFVDAWMFQEKLSSLSRKASHKNKPITKLIWKNRNVNHLVHLHGFLIMEGMIDRIDLSTFQNHFAGLPQAELINWRETMYFLGYLLDELNKFIDRGFYGRKLQCRPKYVVQHFTVDGKKLNPVNFSVAKNFPYSPEAGNRMKRLIGPLLKQLDSQTGNLR